MQQLQQRPLTLPAFDKTTVLYSMTKWVICSRGRNRLCQSLRRHQLEQAYKARPLPRMNGCHDARPCCYTGPHLTRPNLRQRDANLMVVERSSSGGSTR